MDKGLPPTGKRTSPRPTGGNKAGSNHGSPVDPRHETPNGNGNGNGSRPSRSHGATNTPKKSVSKSAKPRDNTAPKGLAAPPAPISKLGAVALVGDDVLPAGLVALSPPRLHEPGSSPDSKSDHPSDGTTDTTSGTDGKSEQTDRADMKSDTSAAPTDANAKVLLPPIRPSDPADAPSGDHTGDHTSDHTSETPPRVYLPHRTEPVDVITDTDGTGGLPSLLKPKKPPRALRAPVVVPQRRRPRVRRVTRVVRHIDTWSVFKVALVFNLFLYGVCLTAGVLLWQVAQNTGTVDNIERFFESFGWQQFTLKGGEIFHNAWVAGLFVIAGFTGLAVLMATLFNLITDLVGGIRVSVLEEEVIAREERGLGWRRSARRTAAADAAAAMAASEPAAIAPAAAPFESS